MPLHDASFFEPDFKNSDQNFLKSAETFPRTGPWSKSNQLGQVKLSEEVNVNQILLKTDEWWMPHVWTLSLWAVPRIVIPDNASVTTTECKIDFGVGGATQSVEVDFVRGVVLSFPTNSIKVTLQKVSVNSFIYAQVSLGTRGTCGCPQKQVMKNLVTLAGANSAGFIIPNFTEYLQFISGSGLSNMIDPLVNVEISSSASFNAGTIIQVVPLSILTPFYAGKLNISSDAFSFRIANGSAADIFLNCFAKLGL